MTMSKFLLLILVMPLTSVLYAQTDKKKVQQTIEAMFTALGKGDTSAFKLNVTSDVRFYEYGQMWNRDTLIHKVMLTKAIPDFKRTDRFEFVSTTIQKNTAWVTYYLQSVFIRNGKEEIVNWMETVILINEKKNWKISVLHSTRLSKK